MSDSNRALLVVVAVPLVAFAVASGLLWKWEKDWQDALAKQYADSTPDQRAALTLIKACSEQKFREAVEGSCSTLDQFRLMRFGSFLTGVAGVGWLALIALAGRLARGNRRLLLHVFRPGLYLTNIFLIILIAAHGVLAMAAIYLGESALIGRIHPFIIIAIGAGAVIGVILVAKATFSIVKIASTAVIGNKVSVEETPALWTLARDAAQTMGVQPPDHIVLGLEPNFFVTEAHVRTLDGELTGRTMFVSLSLSRILTVDELRGILGHELGHYKGQDTEFSTKFYPIYRGTYEGLHALSTTGAEGAFLIALLPAMFVLSFFLNAFAVAENKISRKRELAADKLGAALAGAQTTATALVKVHAFSLLWQHLRTRMVEALREKNMFTNISTVFADGVKHFATPDALAGLDERTLSHPTDSHPPLGVRLQNLGVTLDDVKLSPLAVAPENPAIDLIDSHEAREQRLSDAEHYVLAQVAGISIGDGADQPPRLDSGSPA